MKLKSKLLAALTPVIALSAATPTLVACSKSKDYVIQYGQDINCIYKKADKETYGTYKSIKTIAKAIKKNVTREPKREITVSQANELLTKEDWDQTVYNEIVASKSIINKKPFLLIDWTPDTSSHTIDFGWSTETSPSHTSLSDCEATYINGSTFGEDKIYLQITTDSLSDPLCFKSYIFSDCTIGE